ncbi:hypothetical protein DB31_6227 [Hyalangium minutum]|uniref:Uncharacterized protein n=1 Tax=Hyalangium minutum TaxID=394096 RepID=A0A085VU17_9BACT|nr:hypothetical protein DB31_6227 [Hyalangium minutum]
MAHAHTAEPDGRDLQIAAPQSALLHGFFSCAWRDKPWSHGGLGAWKPMGC